MFGMWEILFIFLIVLLLFGAKKLPEVARGMGKAMNEFKKAKDGLMEPEDASKTAKTEEDTAAQKTMKSVYPDLNEEKSTGEEDGKNA